MMKLQERELTIADERIQSQNIREAAKITQKNRELDLKELQVLNDVKSSQLNRRMRGAEKVLDNAAQLAQIEAGRLSQYAKNDTIGQ